MNSVDYRIHILSVDARDNRSLIKMFYNHGNSTDGSIMEYFITK